MLIRMTVNGAAVEREIEPVRLLVDVLRDDMGLTGTHIGCDTSQCGACTVHLDGVPVKSCTVLAAQADGSRVTTIEGIGSPGHLHPMQAAFSAHHGLQCGFCTPGMIMAGIGIAERLGPDASREAVAHELEGNLCRCTGYLNIVTAIIEGAKAMNAEPARAAA
jgi:carbon-monoxide dehydrogenase small subunit